MTYRVVVATPLSTAGLSELRAEIGGQAEIVPPTALNMHPAIHTAQALIVREETAVTAALLDEMPALRVIGHVGSGIARIDVEEATRRGILVMNAPGINAISAAEYAFALLLALARHIVPAHNQLADGLWDRDPFTGIELYNKTFGIIGLGRVGSQVASRALAFGMKLVAYDPYVIESHLDGLQVKLVGLTELLTSADVVSLHCAPTPETYHLINSENLPMLKPGALLINTAHGSVVEESALLNALNADQLAGAALDVFAHEPPQESMLRRHPRVLHTPHIADNTREAQRDLGVMIVRQVLDALHGRDFRNVVNMPVVHDQPFEAIAPYMRLAEAIGKLAQHLAEGPIYKVSIEFKGEEFENLVKPMTVALLRGLLSPVLGDDHVNYINAPILANERNIFVTQAKGLNRTDYTNLLSCQVQWREEELSIGGALFNHSDPHIVQINQYRTDFRLEGILLIIGSYDLPGVIGRVGHLLGENSINIADWRTGRAERGGHTLSVATLDHPLPDALLHMLREQEYVRHVRQITF
ncbi:MAG: phosphoglycerate dehydrogenase [Chloroflexi bacterium]|nr:phosphoglycerate dehydrogenase [Chloroflexota bacterium]